jgi:NADH dehydrogenase
VSTGILTEGEIAPPLRGVLRGQRNARVLLAEVRGFDLDARSVTAAAPDGEEHQLGYDSLIVAAGASHSYFGHDEWEALAPGLKTLEDARTVRSRILRAFELAELAAGEDERDAWLRFAVVGGGPTGIEVAGQIADLSRRTLRPDYRAVDTAGARIALVEAGLELLPGFPASLRGPAARDLRRIGVDVRLGAAATGIDAEGVDLAGGDRVPARTVIWAAGVAPSPLGGLLAAASGAGVDGGGRLEVERDLTLPGHPEVLAIGDMVALDGVPGVAPAAMQQGRHAARTIRARVRDRPAPGAFRYRDKGSIAVIGHNRAVGTAFGVRFGGLIGLAIWAVVHVAYLVGWGSRAITVGRWLWTLLARDRAERVITPPPALAEARP